MTMKAIDFSKDKKVLVMFSWIDLQAERFLIPPNSYSQLYQLLNLAEQPDQIKVDYEQF